MPYFTKKGTGKDKGKTCVYKKEGRTKVGCTAGPVKKYLAALHLNESDDNGLDWIKDTGSDIEQFISELDLLIKEHVPEATLELDWDQTSEGDEYFGKIWLYDRFYELYKHNKTFTLRFYERDFDDDVYDNLNNYLNLPKTRALTILINELIDYNRKNLSESNDFDWAEGPITVSLGEIYENLEEYLNKGDIIYVTGEFEIIDGDNTIMLQKESATVVEVTHGEKYSLKVDFGEKIILQHPIWEVHFSSGVVHLGGDLGLPSDYKLLITLPEIKRINESEEDSLDWIRDVKTDLIPGKIYDIKTGNGYYWVPELYVGRDWDDEYHMEFYKFKDLDGSGSGRKSVPYVKELIEKNLIRPHDPNWSIKDDIIFSDNIEDALKGNFAIYFKNGVYLDQTLTLQDKLFEMGFSFYTKGPNEYITNKDSSKKIQFFECFNWDTSNKRYSSMPKDQWDRKKILLVHVKKDDDTWFRKRNYSVEEQELFLTITDHNAIVINGDQYVTNNINESDEFDWIRDIQPISYYNLRGKALHFQPAINNPQDLDRIIKYLTDLGFGVTSFLKPGNFDFDGDVVEGLYFNDNDDIIWTGDLDFSGEDYQDHINDYASKEVEVLDGWDIFKGHITESKDEFDWISKQEPEKEFKKSKKYVIYVGDLKPSPMSYSHDPSLTKLDILEKLNNLGYDVNHIDYHSAKYFYVEPCEDCGEWDDSVWIKKDYWVDYDDGKIVDPTYNGKYQMLDIDEFMFLLDNNLISESKKNDDFSWIRDVDVSPEFIALEIFKNTEIIPNAFMGSPMISVPFTNLRYSRPEMFPKGQFNEYIKNNYNIDNTSIKKINTSTNDNNPFSASPYFSYIKSIWDLWVSHVEEKLKKINESDFDWLNMGEPLPICEAINVLKVGDEIMINEIAHWQESFEDDESLKNVKAIVLAIAPCKGIQPTNQSSNPTILIHVDDEYYGFDEYWVSEFKPEYQEICMDGRCMFLICGDEDQDKIMVTPMGSSFLTENKKTINEVAGISFEARKWAEIIYDEIINNPNEEKRIIIDGYDYPEAFDRFPIDYVVIDFYDRLTGYGHQHSGYDKDGNYVVLLYVQPQLVSGQGGYSLQSALNHEMKHAWEDYNRLSKGLPSIDNTKESKELYNKDFILMLSDQNIRGPIKEILKYYYYLSNLEKSAYIENVYDKNPAYEKMVREISNKDFESFKDRFDLDVNWHLMNTAYNIPFLKKFKSPREFIDYSAQELRSRALKMIKKMNKMKYIHGKY